MVAPKYPGPFGLVSRSYGLASLAGLIALAACAEPRELPRSASCPNYEADVAPVLAADCVPCHGSEVAAGGYRLDSYAAIIARDAAGEPRVIAGDISTTMFAVMVGAGGHVLASKDTLALLDHWVGDCELSLVSSDAVHPHGFAAPSSPDFHGIAIARAGWSVAACERCHAAQAAVDGTKPGPSCLTCHAEGLDGCDLCHGSAASFAPPRQSAASPTPAEFAAGAHRQHLAGTRLGRPIACDECHLVPSRWDAPGHVDTAFPAELTFGTLASSGGVEPVWGRDAGTCTTYCHGAGLEAGGEQTEPVWTLLNGSQVRCASCHGAPPPAPHPQDAACDRCHPAIASGRHIDGVVDMAASLCSNCHGDPEVNAAPPRALDGRTEATRLEVGAHQAHLAAASWHRTVLCDDCHLVPARVDSVGHMDSAAPAEVTLGGLSATGGVTPGWDRASARCTTACHDPSRSHEGLSPSWIVEAALDCTGCHAMPPGGSHPTASQCSDCHGAVIAPDGTFIHPERHVDGVVDRNSYHAAGFVAPSAHGTTFNSEGPSACTPCHGSDLRRVLAGVSCESCHPNWQTTCNHCHGATATGAPPPDLSDCTVPSCQGVGAHAVHVSGSGRAAPVACAQCHIVPSSVLDAGHVDGGGAEVVFGGLARTAGSSPTWDGVRCSNYCHGQAFPDGKNALPVWTDTTPLACDACHGSPPTSHGSEATACVTCHAAVVDAARNIVAPTLHIDGVVEAQIPSHPLGYADPTQHGHDFNASGPSACTTCHGVGLDGGVAQRSCESCHAGWQTTCSFCHGMPPAPGVDGETARASLAVGAHLEHTATTALHTGYPCGTCHGSAPSSALSVGHVDGDGRAEVSFNAMNVGATYDPTTGSCGNTYCHSNGRRDAGKITQSVRFGDNLTLGCTSCHPDWYSSDAALQTMSGLHYYHLRAAPWNPACSACHGATVTAQNVIIVGDGGPEHVDGNPDIQIIAVPDYPGTWDPIAGMCSQTVCHTDTRSWW